jgi:predicted nuclease of restriction endonuclease-like (RecB) superfamily
MSPKLVHYAELLGQIKQRISQGQTRAVLSANSEMILTYWDIGRMILQRQDREGWGASVIPRLSRDLHNELPEVKGFSERNIGYMIRFAREYGASPILQQAVAKLQLSENKGDIKVPQAVAKISGDSAQSIVQQLVAKIPWGHNILLMEKVKDLPIRLWYMQQVVKQDWSGMFCSA